MKEQFYINGWRESRSYFFRFGFTEEEVARMRNGETVNKNGNEYRIEIVDD